MNSTFNMWQGAGAKPAFSQDPSMRPPAAPARPQLTSRQRLAKALTDSAMNNQQQGGGFWGAAGNAAGKIGSAYVQSKMPQWYQKKFPGG